MNTYLIDIKLTKEDAPLCKASVKVVLHYWLMKIRSIIILVPVIRIFLLCHWVAKVVLLSQTMPSKTQTNHDLLTHILLH